MPHTFQLHRESLKRKFAIYVVVAKSEGHIYLYVGKVGDNREGCNPLISRCGNHFSYNNVHSQIRNKINDHEIRDYIYVFEHFDDYTDDLDARRRAIDRINEMERWLNQEIQQVAIARADIELLNPYKGKGHISQDERDKRKAFRTSDAGAQIKAVAAAVLAACG